MKSSSLILPSLSTSTMQKSVRRARSEIICAVILPSFLTAARKCAMSRKPLFDLSK